MNNLQGEKREVLRAAATGGAAGYGLTALTGMRAINVVGRTASWGAKAGPAGLVLGALGGLAVYTLMKAWKGEEAVETTPAKK